MSAPALERAACRLLELRRCPGSGCVDLPCARLEDPDESRWCEADFPAIAPELAEALERAEHAEAVAAVDWDGLRGCPTCRRPTGRPCVSQSGRVVGGRTDGVETELEHAHVARQPRKRR